MSNNVIFRVIMVIIIIIGSIIIIIGKRPIPICTVCTFNLQSLLGIAEVVLGAIALNVHNRIIKTANINVR